MRYQFIIAVENQQEVQRKAVEKMRMRKIKCKQVSWGGEVGDNVYACLHVTLPGIAAQSSVC